jgi:hypothetical protein
LRLLGGDDMTVLPAGGFGAIVAYAGIGKTALLVQIALERMLLDQDVLHVSLDHTLDKVTLWYEEVLRELSTIYDKQQIRQLWQEAIPHRMIMTFHVNTFSVPVFEERLTDLIDQNIISPQTVLLDGLSFDEDTMQYHLPQLKELAQRRNLRIWFTVCSHRHEQIGSDDDIPIPLIHVEHLFDTIIGLQPRTQEVRLSILKSSNRELHHLRFVLDPATMLIQNKD